MIFEEKYSELGLIILRELKIEQKGTFMVFCIEKIRNNVVFLTIREFLVK